jgi:hypothetical protein
MDGQNCPVFAYRRKPGKLERPLHKSRKNAAAASQYVFYSGLCGASSAISWLSRPYKAGNRPIQWRRSVDRRLICDTAGARRFTVFLFFFFEGDNK